MLRSTSTACCSVMVKWSWMGLRASLRGMASLLPVEVSLTPLTSGIPPATSFEYSFLAADEGSYWIHSHAPGQYPKGLRTALIVRNAEDPTSYGYQQPVDGKEEIITLSDW